MIVTVHDATHSLVDSATVTATVTFGLSTTTVSCITNPGGQCQVVEQIDDTIGSATFTITDVTKAGFFYDAAANHDPDGDSTGTVITVNRP